MNVANSRDIIEMKENNERRIPHPKGSNGSLRNLCGALSLSTMQIQATARSVSPIIFEVDALKTALCFIDPHSISWFAELAPRIRSSRNRHYCATLWEKPSPRHARSLALLSRIFLTLVWLRYRRTTHFAKSRFKCGMGPVHFQSKCTTL